MQAVRQYKSARFTQWKTWLFQFDSELQFIVITVFIPYIEDMYVFMAKNWFLQKTIEEYNASSAKVPGLRSGTPGCFSLIVNCNS